MKKFINNPHNVVREMLEGFVALNPDQALLADADVIVAADLPEPRRRKVAIISGGGSGHEPAHSGYVGKGMLTAAVAGDVFTSPSVDAVLTAIRATAGPNGAVLIVKNYTGDRLNFGLAAELAIAEGIPTEVVVVADDAALREVVTPERRRGIAGTVLVHKIAGAAAAAGASLPEVAAEARSTAASLCTMGVAIGSCIVPAVGSPSFFLDDKEMELGLGIHGEQGVRKANIVSADLIVDTILDTLIADKGLVAGDRVALLVNGLGGTPPMELAIVARRAVQRLREESLAVERAWCGTFMTSLEMPGISLTLLSVDDARIARLDADARAPAWPGKGVIAEPRHINVNVAREEVMESAVPGPLSATLRKMAMAVAETLQKQESTLTELDMQTGDGDLGVSMARGAAAIRALPENVWANPAVAFTAIGNAVRRAVGGTSGPLYAVGLLRVARTLNFPGAEIDKFVWAHAFLEGVAAISALGGAKPGDRTMVDALQPAAEAFRSAIDAGRSLPDAWQQAVKAADGGAAATASMKPRLGRASYMG
ncbi:MAG: dihydroxyacetone kinase subunit DhaK, partial [Deltaproteobacteria bacterium]|nr:dihydroxyacetone kinase subunit DhaK [Deltaproteobacteria bacterium]